MPKSRTHCLKEFFEALLPSMAHKHVNKQQLRRVDEMGITHSRPITQRLKKFAVDIMHRSCPVLSTQSFHDSAAQVYKLVERNGCPRRIYTLVYIRWLAAGLLCKTAKQNRQLAHSWGLRQDLALLRWGWRPPPTPTIAYQCAGTCKQRHANPQQPDASCIPATGHPVGCGSTLQEVGRACHGVCHCTCDGARCCGCRPNKLQGWAR
mmetsp:Transcript_4363/g.10537  ORF Transcript_4363/g.10537 Transcript_4363/m.10537 type:complete len:207 (-) Transcript_4363:551-1171(-)